MHVAIKAKLLDLVRVIEPGWSAEQVLFTLPVDEKYTLHFRTRSGTISCTVVHNHTPNIVGVETVSLERLQTRSVCTDCVFGTDQLENAAASLQDPDFRAAMYDLVDLRGVEVPFANIEMHVQKASIGHLVTCATHAVTYVTDIWDKLFVPVRERQRPSHRYADTIVDVRTKMTADIQSNVDELFNHESTRTLIRERFAPRNGVALDDTPVQVARYGFVPVATSNKPVKVNVSQGTLLQLAYTPVGALHGKNIVTYPQWVADLLGYEPLSNDQASDDVLLDTAMVLWDPASDGAYEHFEDALNAANAVLRN